jgi:hypothetical protein
VRNIRNRKKKMKRKNSTIEAEMKENIIVAGESRMIEEEVEVDQKKIEGVKEERENILHPLLDLPLLNLNLLILLINHLILMM